MSITPRFSKYILRAALAIGIGTFAGCFPGFEPAPPDPNQILSIINSASVLAVLDPSNPPKYPPLPLPNRFGVPSSPKPLEPFGIPRISVAPLPPNLGDVTPGTAGQVVLANLTQDPLDAVAKLYFMQANQGYSCTAEFVGDSGDVLMTAGHCAYDNNIYTWSTNIAAYLSYDQGASVSAFDWQCVAVYSGWAQKEFSRDYAFIKMRGHSPKALGLSTGLPATQWTSVGYPVNFYSTERLVRVDGTRGGSADGAIEMQNNSMSHGASGGSWISGDNAIGLNSFTINGNSNSMYGPPFDSYTVQLYNFVRNGCLGATPGQTWISEVDTFVKPSHGQTKTLKMPKLCLRVKATDLSVGIVETEKLLRDDHKFPLAISNLEMLFPPAPAGTIECPRGDISLNGNHLSDIGAKCQIKVSETVGAGKITLEVDVPWVVEADRNIDSNGFHLLFSSGKSPQVTIDDPNLNDQFGGNLVEIDSDIQKVTFVMQNSQSGQSSCIRVLK
jgi:hypothetical protein